MVLTLKILELMTLLCDISNQTVFVMKLFCVEDHRRTNYELSDSENFELCIMSHVPITRHDFKHRLEENLNLIVNAPRD